MMEELFKLAAQNKNKGKFTLTVGTVTAVDDNTCTVDNYEDVRLNAVIDDLKSQITIYPKVNSKVIIGQLENDDDVFIVSVSEIDRVVIKIDKQQFEMYEGKFVIKNDKADLKQILNDTYNQLKKSIINTPSGPGNFSPVDVQAFEQLNNKVNQLLK